MYTYVVASTGRLLQIIGLFCNRALQKRRYSAKETYNFKEPTDCSHPISALSLISRIHYMKIREKVDIYIHFVSYFHMHTIHVVSHFSHIYTCIHVVSLFPHVQILTACLTFHLFIFLSHFSFIHHFVSHFSHIYVYPHSLSFSTHTGTYCVSHFHLYISLSHFSLMYHFVSPFPFIRLSTLSLSVTYIHIYLVSPFHIHTYPLHLSRKIGLFVQGSFDIYRSRLTYTGFFEHIAPLRGASLRGD